MGKRRIQDSGLIWAYCRVSTLKGEQELSLDEQIRWAQVFARERGARIRIFRERASAKTIVGRPVCSEMLAELEQPTSELPGMVVATSFDRLSRDMTDTLVLARAVRSAGVKLYIRDRGEVSMTSFADQAALVGQAMGGHAENDARSSRARASWERRRREGKPTSNKSPYGLQLRGERDVPEPVSAAWVHRGFQWYAKGIGTPRIAREFAKNAPPHRVATSRVGADGKPIIRERAHVWEDNRVRKMLRQQRYRGTVVEEALFDRVQRLLAEKPHWRQQRTYEYPFSGAIKCAGCGRSFHGRASGGQVRRKQLADGSWKQYPRYRRIRYYECYLCNFRIRADVLETTALARLEQIALSPKAIDAWVRDEHSDAKPNGAERKALKALLASDAFEKRRQRVWQLAIENNIKGVDLSRQLTMIADEEARARDRLSAIDARAERLDAAQRNVGRARDLLRRFRELYDVAPYEQRRELAFTAIQAVGGAVATASGIRWLRRSELKEPWKKIPHGNANQCCSAT
jgi:DNA invertase Pin-like site-specific DNA recombinase